MGMVLVGHQNIPLPLDTVWLEKNLTFLGKIGTLVDKLPTQASETILAPFYSMGRKKMLRWPNRFLDGRLSRAHFTHSYTVTGMPLSTQISIIIDSMTSQFPPARSLPNFGQCISYASSSPI